MYWHGYFFVNHICDLILLTELIFQHIIGYSTSLQKRFKGVQDTCWHHSNIWNSTFLCVSKRLCAWEEKNIFIMTLVCTKVNFICISYVLDGTMLILWWYENQQKISADTNVPWSFVGFKYLNRQTLATRKCTIKKTILKSTFHLFSYIKFLVTFAFLTYDNWLSRLELKAQEHIFKVHSFVQLLVHW